MHAHAWHCTVRACLPQLLIQVITLCSHACHRRSSNSNSVQCATSAHKAAKFNSLSDAVLYQLSNSTRKGTEHVQRIIPYGE